MGDRFEDRARRLEGDDAVLGEALRNLPELQPRSDLWPEIRQVLERPRRRRRWLFAAAAVLAVAAVSYTHLRAHET